MFARLRAMISDPGAEAADGPDTDAIRLATAALMIHLLAIDGEFTDAERDVMEGALGREYGLTADETATLMEQARQKDLEAVDLYGFTSVLKRDLDDDGRRGVVALLWEMALADGVIHEFEDNMLWRVAELLGISARERVFIRKDVEARRESGD